VLLLLCYLPSIITFDIHIPMQDPVAFFPTFLSTYIFKFLDFQSLIFCEKVCHAYRALVHHPECWKSFKSFELLPANVDKCLAILSSPRFQFLSHLKLARYCSEHDGVDKVVDFLRSGVLCRLKSLDLSKCSSLSPIHLERICDSYLATQLKSLNLGENSHYDNSHISYLSSLTKLTYLNLGGTQLDAHALGHITTLSSLTNIEFDHCWKNVVTGWENLKYFPNLENLRITSSHLTSDETLKNFHYVTKLLNLNISETFTTSVGFQNLPCLQQLQSLNMRNTNLKDDDVAYLTTLQNLTWLNLGKNRNLTDRGVCQILQSMTKLQAVNLGGLNITNVALENLFYLKQLSTLMLSFCSKLTYEGFKHLNAVPSLRSLIARCVMDDAALEHVTGCRSMEILTLGRCPITDKGLFYMPENFPNLSALNIHHSVDVTDEGISYLSQLSQLRMLYLGGCAKITDVGLGHIGKLIHLQALNLGGCVLITDEGLRSLANLKYLQTLDLWKCGKITSVGIGYLKDLAELHSLVLTDCTRDRFSSCGDFRITWQTKNVGY